MKRDLEKLSDTLLKLLNAQKWESTVSVNEEEKIIRVDWKVTNKKAFNKLQKEFDWWVDKHGVPVWQNVEMSKDYTTGSTEFSFSEEDDEIEDEELEELLDTSMEIFEELEERRATHPIGDGIDLIREVEAKFEMLPQIPIETSKVQFVTKSNFGELSNPLKFKKYSFVIPTRLHKRSPHKIEDVIRTLWSDLEFAVLFRRDKPSHQRKNYPKDIRTLDFVFQWECPSVLVMQLAQKIIEDAVKPYHLIMGDEIFGI